MKASTYTVTGKSGANLRLLPSSASELVATLKHGCGMCCGAMAATLMGRSTTPALFTEMAVLTEDDLAEIQAAIDAQYPVEEGNSCTE